MDFPAAEAAGHEFPQSLASPTPGRGAALTALRLFLQFPKRWCPLSFWPGSGSKAILLETPSLPLAGMCSLQTVSLFVSLPFIKKEIYL